MSTARLWVLLLLLAVAPVLASAQDQNPDQTSTGSRAARLAAERERKSTETSPPQRSKIERALHFYDNWSGPPFIFQRWHGFHLAGGSFPAGAGTNVGMVSSATSAQSARRPIPIAPIAWRSTTVGAYSTRGYSRGAAAALNIYNLGGAALDVRIGGQHYEFPAGGFLRVRSGQPGGEPDRLSLEKHGSEAPRLQWKASG